MNPVHEVPALRRILVGVDGTESGRDALELTRLLAAPADASVKAVAVFPYGPLQVNFDVLDTEAAREESDARFEEAERCLGERQLQTVSYLGGSPAWVLNDLAEQEQTDLIVLGSTHRGALGRVFPGSTAENLLHGGPCAVAVAPRGFAGERHDPPLGVVAVAYDGSEESRAALSLAETLAAAGGELRVLTVTGPPQQSSGYEAFAPRVELPDPHNLLDSGLNAIGPEVSARGELLTGPPAETLAGACEEDVDLLVMGSRRYGPARRVLLGSVSAALIRTAPCPVMVLPRGS